MVRNWLVIAFLLCSSILCSARDMAVVVNKASAVKTLPLADFVKVAKATTKKWPDGKPVTLVMTDPSGSGMKTALQKIFGMTADEVKALIAANKQSFIIVDTDAAVIKTVESRPGAIGLLDIYSITGGVNVVKLDGKMPLEPGYALHGS